MSIAWCRLLEWIQTNERYRSRKERGKKKRKPWIYNNVVNEQQQNGEKKTDKLQQPTQIPFEQNDSNNARCVPCTAISFWAIEMQAEKNKENKNQKTMRTAHCSFTYTQTLCVCVDSLDFFPAHILSWPF